MGNGAAFVGANSITLQAYNCEFWGGSLGSETYYVMSLNLINCLLDRCSANVWSLSAYAPCNVAMQNCTLHGGELGIRRYTPWPNLWSVSAMDCAFDGTDVLVEDPYGGGNYQNIAGTHNAYLSDASTLPNDSQDKFVSSFNWQAGPLGNFYLPDDPPASDGTKLIDAGDQDASAIAVTEDNRELDSFTTQTSQEPDCGIVDIGYHYPANPPYLLPPDASWTVTDETDPNNPIPLGSMQAPFGQGYCPSGCGHTISPPINTQWPLNTSWRLDTTFNIPNNVDLSQVKYFLAIDNFVSLTVNGHSIPGYGNQTTSATWVPSEQMGSWYIGEGNLIYGNNTVEVTITDIGGVDYFSMIITTYDCYPSQGPLY
ncbi:MAG: hypothetical protein ACREFE_11170 [Limisphaerales bacterium]